jgi:hypothetical protein
VSSWGRWRWSCGLRRRCVRGLLGTIGGEVERWQLGWLGELAGNGVEHTELLAGKLERLGQAGPPPRVAAGHEQELVDVGDLVRVAE